MSDWKHFYVLADLYRYVRAYQIPLEEPSVLSELGCIVREYMYNPIELKINCRMGRDDRLISCCVSLLPLRNASVSSSMRKRKKKQSCNGTPIDFYAVFNVRRAQSWNEPNPVLFRYPKYTKSNDISRGTQLDFLAQKQISCVVMATPIPSQSRMRRKRRASAAQPPLESKHQHAMLRQRSHGLHDVSMIPSNTAIIYPQDTILWSYFNSKPKVLDQNAWLPIVSLWRQEESHLVYMLRGANKKAFPLNHNKKKRKRSNSVHVRTFTPSEPVPALSPIEKSNKQRSAPIRSFPKQRRRKKSNAKKVKKAKKELKFEYKPLKKSKRARSTSLIDRSSAVNEDKNPCKLYEITVTSNEVICTNVFDFPHLNIQHKLTWFDVETRSLLLIIQKQKGIQLHVIRQTNHTFHSIPQSSTNICNSISENHILLTKTRRGARTKTDKRMSASKLFHRKLENESVRIRIAPPSAYAHWFRECRCLQLFHHKSSNEYVLLVEKSSKHGVRKLLLKLRINFVRSKIETMSFGILKEDLFMGAPYEIIGYDYDRSLVIVDTKYEPLSPLHCNLMKAGMGVRSSSSGNIYKQYNKWFSFASKKFTKYKVITKKFACVPLSGFVDCWTNIYESNPIQKMM
eukprot:169171_1